MGPEVDMSGKFDTKMEVSPGSVKEIGTTMKVCEENLIVCASNCEDHAFVDVIEKTPEENLLMPCANSSEDHVVHREDCTVECDQGMASKGCNEDVEVDVVEDGIPNEEMAAERESLDATENSSSFGCTDSGTGVAGASSDVEVESHMRDDNASLLEFDGLSGMFRTRKKRLTAHWRKFIRPLMWRCKWAELQIRELRSQATKYDKELAECRKRKQCELEKCAADDLAMKSVPVCQNRSVSVMKRQKRKRVEETANLAAYSSCHSLFSYFVSKRPSVDSAYLDDVRGNTEKTSGVDEFGFNDELSFLEFKKDDAFENILRKIEVTQMHVRQLKLRIDKVVRENAEKFTSENSRLAPEEQLASCGPSSNFPHVIGREFPVGSQPTISQQTSQKLVVPESVVSGSRKVNPSDMIETTDQLQIGRKCPKIEDETLVYNQPVKEEPDDTEGIGTRHTAEPELAIEGKDKNIRNASDPISPSKMTATQEQLAVKVRSKFDTPKNKRKRGRRKARTGRWSRRSSG